MNEAKIAEIVDLTSLSDNFPSRPDVEVNRDNMVTTLEGLLKTNSEIIVVEGPEGIGKTTLLANFARKFSKNAFSAFITNSSRYAHDPALIAQNLHQQIQFALGNVTPKNTTDTDIQSLFRASIGELQKKANAEKTVFYFIIDGLDEIATDHKPDLEQIYELLPKGLSHFRFLFSGKTEICEPLKKGKVTFKSWTLPAFSYDDTVKYFHDITSDKAHLEDIYKLSEKGIPNKLAQIRRLCIAKSDRLKELLDNLPDYATDLLEQEWQAATTISRDVQLALAALCFDTRQHTLNTLSQFAGLEPKTLEKTLQQLTFITPQTAPAKPLTFVPHFRKFAITKLEHLKQEVYRRGMEQMLSNPESQESISHLPHFLNQTKSYDQLLEYLSGEHIGKLIDCTQSWIPLHDKVDLGIATAKRLNRDADLLRFGLQRSTVSSLESCEHRKAEIQAYITIGDYVSANALAQTAVTVEDRLHILAIIASSKRKKGVTIEPELKEQITQLYEQVDKKGLGSRGVDIAQELLSIQPELAIDMVKLSQSDEGEVENVDRALTHLSIKTLMDKTSEIEASEACAKLQAQVQDPGMKKFVDALTLLWGSFSASELIALIEKWGNPADQLYVLRVWTQTNRHRKDSAFVINHALDTLVKATDFAPNAAIYRELAMPILYVEDKEAAKSLIDRFDGLKAAVEVVGPTEEFVWLQILLAGAEYSFDQTKASNRLTDIYFDVSDIKDLSVKAACLVRLTSILQRVDPDSQNSEIKGLMTSSHTDLEETFRLLLTETGDHYEAVEPAIVALTRSAPNRAFELAKSLNTEPRRVLAFSKILTSLSDRDSKRIEPAFVETVLNEIKYPAAKNSTLVQFSKGLRTRKKNCSALIPMLKKLVKESNTMTCYESRCSFLMNCHEIFVAHPDKADEEYLNFVKNELKASWKTLDTSYEILQMGFTIVAEIGQHDATFAAELLKELRTYKSQAIFDTQHSTEAYVACCRLAIRAFTGLIKKQAFGNADIDELEILVDRIPSPLVKTCIWADLALRFRNEGADARATDITKKHVISCLGEIPDTSKEERASAIISAAPAIYKWHAARANDIISTLTDDQKDEAHRAICNYLLLNELPLDHYDGHRINKELIPIETIWDICEQISKFEADNLACVFIENLVDHIVAKRNFNSYSREQIADIITRLKKLLSKFPSPKFIQHEGYKILAEAQIARIEKPGPGVWEALANRARALPNQSDQAYVLTLLAGAMPSLSKFESKKKLLFEEAKRKIETLSAIHERIHRYEAITKTALDFDKNISKDALSMAIQWTFDKETKDGNSTRKRLVDTAYRLDKAFASKLASDMDTDPARRSKRVEMKLQFETLELRDSIQSGDEKKVTVKRNSPEKMAEAAWMALKNLNSGKIQAIEHVHTKNYVQEASKLKLVHAYPMLSLIIENEAKQYKGTDQSNTYLKPLYKACVMGAELTFRISQKMRNIETAHMASMSAKASDEASLILGGEREKAIEKIKAWVRNQAAEYIQICDPYFGTEDLEIIKLIREENRDIPITVITSRKHQESEQIRTPYEETYQSYWRLNVLESDPGEVKIIIIGQKEGGAVPIHDRWLISKTSGLRLGSSINSIGFTKAAEVSDVEQKDLPALQELLNKYSTGSVRLITGERLLSSSFDLWI